MNYEERMDGLKMESIGNMLQALFSLTPVYGRWSLNGRMGQRAQWFEGNDLLSFVIQQLENQHT